MKKREKFVLVLAPLLISAILISGCLHQKQQTSPEDVVKVALDNLIKKNYEKAFSYFIDGNDNPLSQETKDQFKSNVEQTPVVSYKVKDSIDLTPNMPEYAILNRTIFKEAKIVSFTITSKDERSEDEKAILVQHEGVWKVLLATS